MVLTGGEVPGGVGGALLVVQQREGVQLVGGAGRQLAQRVRPVAGALHRNVAGRVRRQPVRQGDHLHNHIYFIYFSVLRNNIFDQIRSYIVKLYH